MEHPPLGKTFIAGYSDNDTAFPILAVAKDPRLFPTPPAVGSTTGLSTEAIASFPNNKFSSVERVSEERILWLYELLPGPAVVVSDEIDPKSGMRVLRTRQKKAIAGITEGVTKDASNNFVTVIAAEGIDGQSAYANEIKTIYYKSPHYSYETAKVESGNRQIVFPGYILSWGDYGGVTVTAIDAFGSDVGVKSGVSSDVEATYKTYWVIAAEKPEVAYDQIIYGSAYINERKYDRMLFDDLSRSWPGWGIYTQPGTTPTATEYRGSSGTASSGSPPPDPFSPGTGDKWVGTMKKPEAPEIAHYLAPNYIWQVRECEILMRDSANEV